jgi:hypothetical protein
MRHAGTTSPAGRGYSDAFGDWLFNNHLNVPAPARAKLLVLMGNLAEIEQWRLTLTPTERLRMNHPSAVLKNYWRATGIKPPLERDSARRTCPAASRRRTAPSSCGAAGGDALNAVGHFVVVYRPTAYT